MDQDCSEVSAGVGADNRHREEKGSRVIMLDSGAYSAWKRGREIDLAAYIGFVKYNAPHVDHYISLDVIPGRNGQRDRSPEAVECAAQQSYRNHCAMKDAGLHPIPVFHMDERFEWLERMITDGEKYIALSPSLRAHRKEIQRWLRFCFKHVPPRVKVHGLGVTSAALLGRWRHRWSSVDSSTWVQVSAKGRLIVPRYGGDDKPNFSLPPRHIPVTRRLIAKGGSHIENIDRERVHQWLDEVGVSLVSVRNDLYVRYFVHLMYFRCLEAVTGVPIFHATHPGNLDQRGAFSRAGIKHRLVSFFDFMDLSDEDVFRQCLHGVNQWRSDHYLSMRALEMHRRNLAREYDDRDDYFE
jgi:hypothetical protein